MSKESFGILDQLYLPKNIGQASWKHYAIALLCITNAILIDNLVSKITPENPYLIFFVAVLVTAWFGGMGPGLFASLLGTIAGNYFFVPPYNLLNFRWEDILTLGLFLQVAFLGSSLSASRRRTSAVLRAGQQLFSSFMSASPTLAFIKDEQGCYIYVNKTIARLMGDEQAEWLGKTDFEIWPGETAAQFDEHDQEVRAGQHLVEKTINIMVKGELRSWIIFKFPIKDASNRNLLGGTTVDITERVQSELALRIEKEHSAVIINYSPTIICRLSPDGVIKFINPAGEKITGYDRESLMGRNWWTTFYPDPAYREDQQHYLQKRTGELLDYETTITTRHGEERIILWNWIKRLDEVKSLWELIGFGRDITTRVKMEQELKKTVEKLKVAKGEWEQTVDALQELVLLIDSEQCVLRTNRTVERWGINSVKQSRGQNIHDFLHSDCSSYNCRLADLLVEMLSVCLVEQHVYRELQDDRLNRRITIDCTLFEPNKESLNGDHDHNFVVIIRDITKLHALQQANKRRDHFEAMEYLVGRFAHQIGNPLAAMKTTAQVWQRNFDKLDAEKQLDYLRKINDRINHLEYIVKHIKSGQGWQVNSLAMMRLDELLTNTYQVFHEAILEREIDFVLLPVREKIVLWCNPKAVDEIIGNIIKNALEACRTGDKITLAGAMMNDKVMISISDTGCGMSEATRENLFVPFFTTKPNGSGIGLSHVNFLMEQLDGEIKIESQEGLGTKVMLFFNGEAR